MAVPKMMRYSVIPTWTVSLNENVALARWGRRKLTGVDDVHRAHSATGVVEDPFLDLIQMRTRWRPSQLVDDVCNHCAGIIAVFLDSIQRYGVELFWSEDVEAF